MDYSIYLLHSQADIFLIDATLTSLCFASLSPKVNHKWCWELIKLLYQFPHQFGSHQMQHHDNLVATGNNRIAVSVHVNTSWWFLDTLLPLIRILTIQQWLAVDVTFYQLCSITILHKHSHIMNSQITMIM